MMSRFQGPRLLRKGRFSLTRGTKPLKVRVKPPTPTVKTILLLLTLLITPQLIQAQDLAAQQAQARQVAASNGAADPADIAAQLAEAFGAGQNTEALISKATQLAEANPAEAKAIAAAAAVFSPSSAAQIARAIASIPAVQADAAAVAAAVAAVAPSNAAAIAAAVAGVAPASAAAIMSAVSQAAAGQGGSYKSTVDNADPDAAITDGLAPGAGADNAGNTVGLPSTTQFTSLNPANYSANQATPTPTPSRPNSPSN
jgi:hypothetical protein